MASPARRWPAPGKACRPAPSPAAAALHVPATALTAPAPATTFGFLDAFIVLSRPISEKGIYPAVDPLGSTSRILDPQYVGAEHYEGPQTAQPVPQGSPE